MTDMVGFRYETVSETEGGKVCLDRLTGDAVEFRLDGMYFVEAARIPRPVSGSRAPLRMPA